jgi:hypothetical protein
MTIQKQIENSRQHKDKVVFFDKYNTQNIIFFSTG